MDLEKEKLLLDSLGKRVDILHKKILILLGGVAGSWIYGIKFLEYENVLINIVGILMFLIFIFLTTGLIFGFLKLNRFDKNIEKVQNGLE